VSVHGEVVGSRRETAFDFVKWPSEVLREQIREIRVARGITQRQLAEQMSRAGASTMTHVTVSQIERGKREVSVDELCLFAAVLEKPIVRLLSPRPDDETEVLVTRLYRSVDFRNWMVYGDAWKPAARGAQQMMRLAYCSLILGRKREGPARKAEAREELVELFSEIERAN
jgi:transcriptional regulator with XRE-family HTH domain